MSDSRKNFAYLFLLGAAAAGLAGFLVGKNATDSFRPQPPGMWVLYGLAGILVLGAIMMFAAAQAPTAQPPSPSSAPGLVPGWYDDPESPRTLRYWDGAAWTDKTADKGATQD